MKPSEEVEPSEEIIRAVAQEIWNIDEDGPVPASLLDPVEIDGRTGWSGLRIGARNACRAAISSMGGLGEDRRPDFVGSISAKVESYNQIHEIAVELGYPSATEAFEALDDFQTGERDARRQALEEAAKVARQVEQSRRHWHRSNYGSRTGLDQAEGAGMVATAIEALIQPRGEG